MEITVRKIDRPDLRQRREVKYALQGADVGKLRELLKGACRTVSYNKRVSIVRSIYFDDWNMRTFRANINGLCKRKKVRLRWYDQNLPELTAVFEIKWRDNLLTGKHRFQVEASSPIYNLSYSKIVHTIADALPQQYRETLLWHSDPVVIVQYKREHFISYDGEIRLTLDYELVFHDQRALQKPKVSSFPLMKPEYIVIEGKCPLGKEQKLHEILAPFQPRSTRSSKYVIACETIGGFNSGINPTDF